jgi:hypothetical protein
MKQWLLRLLGLKDPPGPPVPSLATTPPPETEIEVTYGSLPDEGPYEPIPEVLDDRPITSRITIIDPTRKR